MSNNEKGFITDPIIFNNESIKGKFIDSPNNNPGLIVPMDFDTRTKDAEEKVYIILYKIIDDSIEADMSNVYSLCLGRTEAYNDIKNKFQSGLSVDMHRSKIITETKQTESSSGDRKYYLIPYDECISIYSFCIACQDYYSYDDFSIEDYNDSEVPENYNELETHPNFLTAEQLEYRKMLDAAMSRDDMFDRIRADTKENSSNNI